MNTDGGTFSFNFCEATVTPPDGCDGGDFFAYFIPPVGTGPCVGLNANGNSNNVANDMMDDNSLTGLSLTYMNDNGNVGLNLNITCDANV